MTHTVRNGPRHARTVPNTAACHSPGVDFQEIHRWFVESLNLAAECLGVLLEECVFDRCAIYLREAGQAIVVQLCAGCMLFDGLDMDLRQHGSEKQDTNAVRGGSPAVALHIGRVELNGLNCSVSTHSNFDLAQQS